MYVRVHVLVCREYTENAGYARRNPRGKRLKVWSGDDEGRYGGAGREKRIETLGFSLETDDACGSLRVRDYERQLEIRSKQMDCENTSSLSLSLCLPLAP